MKEVFHLIVSYFEDLSDTSSRSYIKRASILEMMAKDRYCVVMVDLECDQQIIEMFQHSFRDMRVDHSEIILESMETVMTFVLKESGDTSSALVISILAILKENKCQMQLNCLRRLLETVQTS